MLPQYSMMNKFHLVDTHTGYVLMQSFTAFGVFLMRQFFMSLPNELLEAGRIDGLSEYGNYFRIALPLSKPSIATMTIFALWQYGMIIWGLCYFNSTSKKTIQLGIKMFIRSVFHGIWTGNGGECAVFDSGADYFPGADRNFSCRGLHPVGLRGEVKHSRPPFRPQRLCAACPDRRSPFFPQPAPAILRSLQGDAFARDKHAAGTRPQSNAA